MLKPVSHQPYGSCTSTFYAKSQGFVRQTQDCRAKLPLRKTAATRQTGFSTCSFSLRYSTHFWISHGCRKSAARLSYVCLAAPLPHVCTLAFIPSWIAGPAVRLSQGCLKAAAGLPHVLQQGTTRRTTIAWSRESAVRQPCVSPAASVRLLNVRTPCVPCDCRATDVRRWCAVRTFAFCLRHPTQGKSYDL